MIDPIKYIKQSRNTQRCRNGDPWFVDYKQGNNHAEYKENRIKSFWLCKWFNIERGRS